MVYYVLWSQPNSFVALGSKFYYSRSQTEGLSSDKVAAQGSRLARLIYNIEVDNIRAEVDEDVFSLLR